MTSRLAKHRFMLRKLVRDLRRPRVIYPLASEMKSPDLGQYYLVMDETKLRSGYGQTFLFDKNGIPQIMAYIDVPDRRPIYYPISIGQFALAVFDTFLRTQEPADQHRFGVLANWFVQHRVEDSTRGTIWPTPVPRPEYGLAAGWPSAFAQSRALSVLLRQYQLSGDTQYIEIAEDALRPFQCSAADGGVTSFTDYGPFYEEYPADSPTLVLDGFFFALFGLFDFLRVVPDHELARKLFDEGVATARCILREFDLGYWIRYNWCRRPGYPQVDPATINYFRLVLSQLEVMHQITGCTEFSNVASRWRKYDRWPNRVRMYLAKFAALKALDRL